MRSRFSNQMMILGVSKPKPFEAQIVMKSKSYKKLLQILNKTMKKTLYSKLRLQKKMRQQISLARIPDPAEISVAKYLLRFPGSILIRSWVPQFLNEIQNNQK